MPSPPPATPTTDDGLDFLDEVKKFIGSKKTYNEFLKLWNLFSQGLIDEAAFYDKVRHFIVGNTELLEWLKKLIQQDGATDEAQHTPQPMNKVPLSACRSLGPSYRLLPRQVCIPFYTYCLLTLRLLSPTRTFNFFPASSFRALLSESLTSESSPLEYILPKHHFPNHFFSTPHPLRTTSF